MDAIVDALAEQNDELAAMLAGRGEGEARQPSACEGWSILDVVLHLAQTNEIALASVEHRFPGAAGELARAGDTVVDNVDEAADLSVATERDRPWPEVHDRWLTAVDKMQAAFRAADPSARVQWVAGDMAARTLATTRLAETWIHTGDVAGGLGSTPVPSDRLEHIARLAWRTLPYAFARDGRDPPGPVAFELVAPSGDRWDFGTGMDAPTVIRGPGVDLCLVASRRVLPGDTALTGDGPDADAVLELVPDVGMTNERGTLMGNPAVTRRAVLGGIGALLVAAACSGKDGNGARAATTSTTAAAPKKPATAWLGAPMATAPDANGLLLPEGFRSRVIATVDQPVGSTGYIWPPSPDGGATYVDPEEEGGWYYVANSETLSTQGAGVSSIRFDPDGEIVDAYRLVGDTSINCAGGRTPWDTWLTCEETEGGRIFECDPTTPNSGEDRPALGRFVHEAACVDEQGRKVYLTEDRPDGLFYRFTPERWPDLSAGVLEAAAVDEDGVVTWHEVPDPSAATAPIRTQGFGATPFNGGEGIVSGDTPDGPRVWFATKGDDVIRELDPKAGTLDPIYQGQPDTTLHGVDNLWWDEPSQRLFVAEDGDNLELVVLDRTGLGWAPFLQLTGHDGSELAGPALNPRRDTLHFSSQRGKTNTGLGITYAVTGPFPSL